MLAPAWADDWGRDDLRTLGRSMCGKVQLRRLRWIPPGTFWMGSRRRGRADILMKDRGTKKTIASGFWMFDTPCTQDLWQAVMGENHEVDTERAGSSGRECDLGSMSGIREAVEGKV